MTLEEVLSQIQDKPVKEALNARCLSFLRNGGVSETLIAKLSACAYAGPIRIGRVSLSRLAEVDRENLDDANARCIENGFLLVGRGLNGDGIAVELSSSRMAYVSHDLLWEGAYATFSDCVVRTRLTFDEFWASAASDPEFPFDSYRAEERWSQPAGT